MFVMIVFVGCSGCDELVKIGDEVDCMQYRGQSYADVMDLEPRCGPTAWSWQQTVVNDRGETRADLMEESERSQRTFAIALAEFEEAERARIACFSLGVGRKGYHPSTCATVDDLLAQLDSLVKEFPGRIAAIQPHVARLTVTRSRELQRQVAAFERQMTEEQFVLTTNYGRLEAEGKIPSKLHIPRCGLGIEDFGKYTEFLLTMRALGMDVASNRIHLVQQQIGWQYEWPIVCEGDSSSNYEAAYKAYVAAESTEDAQRAAGKQWRELVDDVCGEYNFEDPRDPSVIVRGDFQCNPVELDDPETQQWLKWARIPEAGQREAIVAEAREAEQFGLPCEALDLASRAGDLERVRLLQQEHPRCVIEPVAPSGK